MNEETKRKLEEEEKRHGEEVKRILTEKERGWSDVEPEVSVRQVALGKTWYFCIEDCFSSESKAKECAAKIELFLRMSKECDENKYNHADIFFIIHDAIETGSVPEVYMGMDMSQGTLIEKFGEEILKIWVRGEYD